VLLVLLLWRGGVIVRAMVMVWWCAGSPEEDTIIKCIKIGVCWRDEGLTNVHNGGGQWWMVWFFG